MRKNTLNTKFYILHSSPGFTFVELMIVLALIGIMAGIVVIYIDPPRQLAKARNNRRWANVSTVLNAVGENIADNKGTFSCVSGELPTSTKRMAPGAENYDIAPCLVPNYLPNLPFDPSASGARYSSTTDYDTAYDVVRNATTGRVTVSAPYAELGIPVSITR